MANIFLKPTAQFKPFSYQEMLAPIKAYQDAYDAYDAQLNNLLEDAATKAFNFAPQDTAEKEQYDALVDRIKKASEEMGNGNFNSQLMKEIQNINKDYRIKMIPIQQKIAKRAELAKEQRDIVKDNSNVRFTKDWSQASLNDVTSASSYGIINLDNILKGVATRFKEYTSTIVRNDFEPIPIGNTSNVLITTGTGYTPVEFEVKMGNKNSDVYKFYENEVASIDKNLPTSIQQEWDTMIRRGMSIAAGDFKQDTVIDYSTKPTGGRGGKGGTGSTDELLIQVSSDTDDYALVTFNKQMYKAKTVKDEDGNVLRDAEGNPIIDVSTLEKPGTSKDEIGDIQVEVTEILNSKGQVVKATQKTTYPPGQKPPQGASKSGGNSGSESGNASEDAASNYGGRFGKKK